MAKCSNCSKPVGCSCSLRAGLCATCVKAQAPKPQGPVIPKP